ncbi:hypothetical protein BDW59DRAFT_144299 [Aspergillus cavernicola]|uniref:Uncharacterized protein n=1 Tax=Aspergillus cavernicola TaxID=176166 RepID=A0ABR4IIT3_9EURO
MHTAQALSKRSFWSVIVIFVYILVAVFFPCDFKPARLGLSQLLGGSGDSRHPREISCDQSFT